MEIALSVLIALSISTSQSLVKILKQLEELEMIKTAKEELALLANPQRLLAKLQLE